MYTIVFQMQVVLKGFKACIGSSFHLMKAKKVASYTCVEGETDLHLSTLESIIVGDAISIFARLAGTATKKINEAKNHISTATFESPSKDKLSKKVIRHAPQKTGSSVGGGGAAAARDGGGGGAAADRGRSRESLLGPETHALPAMSPSTTAAMLTMASATTPERRTMQNAIEAVAAKPVSVEKMSLADRALFFTEFNKVSKQGQDVMMHGAMQSFDPAYAGAMRIAVQVGNAGMKYCLGCFDEFGGIGAASTPHQSCLKPAKHTALCGGCTAKQTFCIFCEAEKPRL